MYLGIDPGKSGGLCLIDGEFIKAYKCPRDVKDMALLFAMAISSNKTKTVTAYIEHVWARPTDGKSNIWTFAENYGMWKGIAGSYEIDLKLEKARRKRYLRDKARSMYPELKKVTLNTADAILIANYGKEIDANNNK